MMETAKFWLLFFAVLIAVPVTSVIMARRTSQQWLARLIAALMGCIGIGACGLGVYFLNQQSWAALAGIGYFIAAIPYTIAAWLSWRAGAKT